MITFHSVRSDMPSYPTSRPLSVQAALDILVRFEFGYGGYVDDVLVTDTNARLEVHTPIMGHTDIETFSGPRSEMDLLLEAAHYHERLNRVGRSQITACVVESLKNVGNTLLFTSLAPMLLGQRFAVGVYLCLIGESAAPHLEAIKQLRLEDLAAVATLVREGVTITEAIELAA